MTAMNRNRVRRAISRLSIAADDMEDDEGDLEFCLNFLRANIDALEELLDEEDG